MVLEIHPEHPEPRKIRRAVEALRAGHAIAYPTDTVYGLGCDILQKRAIENVQRIKGVGPDHPLAFVCADLSGIARWAVVDNRAYRLLRRALPGPYCFILEASPEVPRLLHVRKRTVGIRVPDHAVAQALVRELGHPIVSTSASRGDEPFVDAREIDDAFPGLELVLDGGPGGTVPSTVIDLTGPEPVIVRQGAGDVAPLLG
ncbi:MAG: L-threonylcarbamoyladenylate synthase [Myxococcota bacterium]|nr:L-threonylcarbamoyladenylate synthase [Myxococcota bacterium]MDW8364010.1 L-threonylcarbamoyladenylate synthase [Myxococcales bacterium]